MRIAELLSRIFHGPAWVTFLVMGVATGGVALCSYDLFAIFRANFQLIADYGVMAAADGALLQLLKLAFWGYLGLGCYVVFKGCVDGLLARVPRPETQSASAEVEAAPIFDPPRQA